MTANTQSFTTLPLNTLRVDEKSNVRTVGRGTVDPVLLASIRAHGLLQPMRVRANGKGHVVIDGGQRLAALQQLVKGGEFPADYQAPVIVDGAVSDNEAREASLALNVARVAMTPVDEYRAFAALHHDKANPLDVPTIAKRFGVTERRVEQRLALGSLDSTVLDAFAAGEIDGAAIRLFTLAPSQKARRAALEKARAGYLNMFNIRAALGLDNNARMGGLLKLVTEEAYLARGGKVTHDLFADDRTDHTIVSDPALLTAMGEEQLDKQIAELQTQGWGTVTKDVPQAMWEYPRIEVTAKPTKAETTRLKEIDKITAAAEEADEYPENVDPEALDEERDAIQQAIENRALATIDPKVKAKGIAFVNLNHSGDRIEVTLRKQKPVVKETPAERKAAEAKKARPADEAVSKALIQRLGEQLNSAAQATIDRQPIVALAALLAGFASGDQACGVSIRGQHGYKSSFEPAFAAALKLSTAEQVKELAKIAAKATNLVSFNGASLENRSFKAVTEAIEGKALNAALREKFDAKDYFGSVSRATIVAAVAEAMGKDHAANVAKMDKAGAVKFAIGNLPKTKWLPKQLRTSSYDGPSAKAKPAAKAKAKR